MSDRNLSVLTHPSFAQGFDRLHDLVDRAFARQAPPVRTLCDYETPETSWGACDGIVCRQPASVHSLADGQQYCLGHYREMALRQAADRG